VCSSDLQSIYSKCTVSSRIRISKANIISTGVAASIHVLKNFAIMRLHINQLDPGLYARKSGRYK